MEIDPSDILVVEAHAQAQVLPIADGRRHLLRSIVLGTMAGCLILLGIAAVRPKSSVGSSAASPAKTLPAPPVMTTSVDPTPWKPVVTEPVSARLAIQRDGRVTVRRGRPPNSLR